MATYEVALKGAYRKKRCILGYMESDKKPDIDTALNAIGWQYYDTRAFDHRTFTDNNGNLIIDYSISIKKIKI